MAVKTSRRSLANTLAIGLVAVMGVSACTSLPSAKRVAQDLVKTETADQPVVQTCMLKVIDQYDKDFGLDSLGNDANSNNAEVKAKAQATLDKFQADLAACR